MSVLQESVHHLQKLASLKAQLPFVNAQIKLDAQAKRLSIEREIAGLNAGIKASRDAELEKLHVLDASLSNILPESEEDKQKRIMGSMDSPPVPGETDAFPEANIVSDAGNKRLAVQVT